MYNNGGLEQFKVKYEAAEQEEPKDEIPRSISLDQNQNLKNKKKPE